jgi:hypothetical protein
MPYVVRVPRAGVWLSPLQARIFDAVRRATPAGGIDLMEIMGSERSRHCIKAHVWQINRLIRPGGLEIAGARGKYVDGYRLKKVQKYGKKFRKKFRQK